MDFEMDEIAGASPGNFEMPVPLRSRPAFIMGLPSEDHRR